MFRKKKPEPQPPKYGPMYTFRVAQVACKQSDDEGTMDLDLDQSPPPWLHLGRAIESGYIEQRDATGAVTAILHPTEAVLIYPGQHTQRVTLKHRVDHTHEVQS